MSEKKLLCLSVTSAEEEAIRDLYVKNGWSISTVTKDEHAKLWIRKAALEDEIARTADAAQPAPLPAADPDHPDNECPRCFCKPCCTHDDNRQMWWPIVNGLPHRINRATRLKIYKCFWAMLLNRGVWKDERYVVRKSNAMSLDPLLRDYVWHKRDIMPDCVLKLVRTWYPNPEGEPYIGHQWEN